MKTTRDLVLAELRRHEGVERGIRGRDLAAALGCSERELRTHISELIIDYDIHIGGLPETGYFIAANAEELIPTINRHMKRAKHELLVASRLSGKPLLELAGQERLKT